MITFVRSGNEVVCKVTVYITSVGLREFYFKWNCGGVDYAGLLSGAMSEQLRIKMRVAREKAYAEGFSDGRKKKKRKTWFSDEVDNV